MVGKGVEYSGDLKGMYIVTASSNNILTATETEKISQAMTLIRDVVGNSTQSSREFRL